MYKIKILEIWVRQKGNEGEIDKSSCMKSRACSRKGVDTVTRERGLVKHHTSWTADVRRECRRHFRICLISVRGT